MTSRSECIGLLFSLSIDETVFFNDARFVNLKKEKLYKIVKKKATTKKVPGSPKTKGDVFKSHVWSNRQSSVKMDLISVNVKLKKQQILRFLEVETKLQLQLIIIFTVNKWRNCL